MNLLEKIKINNAERPQKDAFEKEFIALYPQVFSDLKDCRNGVTDALHRFFLDMAFDAFKLQSDVMAAQSLIMSLQQEAGLASLKKQINRHAPTKGKKV